MFKRFYDFLISSYIPILVTFFVIFAYMLCLTFSVVYNFPLIILRFSLYIIFSFLVSYVILLFLSILQNLQYGVLNSFDLKAKRKVQMNSKDRKGQGGVKLL